MLNQFERRCGKLSSKEAELTKNEKREWDRGWSNGSSIRSPRSSLERDEDVDSGEGLYSPEGRRGREEGVEV